MVPLNGCEDLLEGVGCHTEIHHFSLMYVHVEEDTWTCVGDSGEIHIYCIIRMPNYPLVTPTCITHENKCDVIGATYVHSLLTVPSAQPAALSYSCLPHVVLSYCTKLQLSVCLFVNISCKHVVCW